MPPASSYPSAASDSAPVRLWESIQGWLAFFRGLTLAAGSALSCGVSAAGLALLLFLAVTLTFAPATDTFSRRLEMDYVGGDLVGEAAFLPAAATADGLPPSDVQRDARCCAPACSAQAGCPALLGGREATAHRGACGFCWRAARERCRPS